MNFDALIAIAVAGSVASLGVWWLTYVMPEVKNMQKPTRYGIFTALWLAYFACVIVIAGAIR